MPAPPNHEAFWVDDFGYLWRGPREPGGPSKLYTWMRFEGISRTGRPVWHWHDPVPGLCEVSQKVAARMIARFLAEEG